ncbi:PilZ domain-containing protein [Methyloterricola oryzae]|uniref:PilZ domain-containing protein n=1 Tax=Methyloterricola oryzae TaxID=1495050 RepID=UPI0005EADA1C|nr:PilZ domain-containing protein [Methyloterricola oryzae]
MVEQRAHPRIPVSTEVTVSHARFGTASARTVDVSEGGVLIEFLGCPFAVGDQVSVQVSSLEDAPLLQGTVVRVRSNEFALRFDPSDDEESAS